MRTCSSGSPATAPRPCRRRCGGSATPGRSHRSSLAGTRSACPGGRVREGPLAGVHAGSAPKAWLTVYPFVRSYEWYLLPEEERRALLRDHGGKGREYPQVLSNTVASFALGDYEWLLASSPTSSSTSSTSCGISGHRRAPPRPRGDPVLHRPSPDDRRALEARPRVDAVTLREPSGRRARPVRDPGGIGRRRHRHRRGPGPLRRNPARRIRRAGGPGGRHPVPAERHPRRGIPYERLEEVAQHYRHFGGISPINAQNRALKAALEAELAARGIDLPVYWGNRNWAPYLDDAVQEAAGSGATTLPRARHLRVLEPSRRAGSTGEDFARVLDATGLAATVRIDKVRQFFDHPGFRGAVRRRRGRRGARVLGGGDPSRRDRRAVLHAFRPGVPMRSAPVPVTATSAREAPTPRSTPPSPPT